jgi:hypothetical protein
MKLRLRKRKSENPVESQTLSGEAHRTPLRGRDDHIYAVLRRLTARLSQLEASVSTLRRDLNRVDRQVYRKQGSPSNKTSDLDELLTYRGESEVDDEFSKLLRGL